MTLLLHTFSLSAMAASELPLEKTEVDVLITGPYAELTVTQVFSNPNEDFIEALYTFPLHQDAAVDDMEMRMGDRVIKGEIQTKEDARNTYEEAVSNGQTAALTEQSRDNIFHQSIGNIAPHETITVTLHMTQPMTWEDGVYTFEYPMTVGPRFAPATLVEDHEAVTPPTSIGPTGATVDIDVAVELGMPIGEVWSQTHGVQELEGDDSYDTGYRTSLHDLNGDKDFVLNIDPQNDQPLASLLVQDGHFALTLEPQQAPVADHVVPRELIFVVDNSCSMNGVPMGMAKDAMRQALSGMLPNDSFQVIRFSDAASQMSAEPLPATPENIEKGLAFVDGMNGMGGTHMMAGIEASLDYPYDPERQRIVCFMTDGYIGNESQILAAIEDKLGPTRLFSFGIGSSVNRYLLDEMSDIGRGHVTYVLLNESPEGKVEEFYDRIARPVLTDITLDFHGAEIDAVYPERAPDLFAGAPLQLVGRYDGDLTQVTIRGRQGHRQYEETLTLVPVDDGTAVASTWARQRVKALERHMNHGEDQDTIDEIVETALSYRLLTRHTSFVAVEYRMRNDGDMTTLVQPSEAPEGVDVMKAVGGDVSRVYMPPGDPLLTIEAPADAQEVIALFPWGPVVELEWDALRGRWFHRFLVPRDVEDGEYVIRAFVTMADGSTEVWTETMHIDSHAPELEVEVTSDRGVTRVELWPEEPLRSILVTPVGHPELAHRVDLRGRDEESIVVVLPGVFDEVTIVAKDRAMNRVEVTATKE
ncbi:MAG: VWA domain-containing protein [Proteobacteria bacterium]|nr:VWA domain-containing protein [Pseudomonadota bacterium]MCP4919604.1 VWA domain-containing protein [Pseudomonadota bacterium]